ncbi:hypothetical protein [Xenorhabdus hominickii]|uniref:Uncharacterized protein n=1 Tax=Xenorhabdus hominickii TaxID=351679 RepID=A0A2G0Q9W5_XENHO|nr:hypothetical protein [Xenorhabdus hominickii]AOM42863.1 hypothetical protein A9255_10650 [Xenorhabdus hominickii]PHM56027.1 hypothetical protein Xhom_01492 [Xenorhabdus hominickii]
MGLDIYFFADDKENTQKFDVKNTKSEVGYFRKVNSLFAWIESHVESIGNCKPILISQDVLQKLASDLDKLIPANCDELFPSRRGFFFGSDEYDECYWLDVEDVKNWVKGMLNDFDFESQNLYFWAWW